MVSMTPGGAQRSTAECVACRIAAPLSLLPVWPMKRLEPVASQMRPGISPWIGCCWAAHATSNAGAASASLRVDGLLGHDPAHLELTILDPEGEATLDKIERILAELFVAPSTQDIEVLADASRERFEIVRSGNQTRRDTSLLGADFQQQFQQIADERRIFG